MRRILAALGLTAAVVSPLAVSRAAPPAAPQPCSVNVALLMDAAGGTLATTGTTVNCEPVPPAPTPTPAPASNPLRLDYNQTATLFNGTDLVPRAWVTWLPAQTFTTAGGPLLLICNQTPTIYAGSDGHSVTVWRFVVDGVPAGQFGRMVWNQSANAPAYGSASGNAWIGGLPAGPHTVSIQYYTVYPFGGATPNKAYLRPGSAVDSEGNPTPYLPVIESLRLQVVEFG